MRDPRDTDFFVELPDVGTFRFGRRTYGDRLNIRGQLLRLLRDQESDNDEDMHFYASIIAAHSVLCVEAPDGWDDIASLDLTGPGNTDAKVIELFALLHDKEATLKKVGEKSGEAVGA